MRTKVLIAVALIISLSACLAEGDSIHLSTDTLPDNSSLSLVSDDPTTFGYTLKGAMQGSSSLVNQGYAAIHTYMRSYGWDYSEHPNNSATDHNDGNHCKVVYDPGIGQYVFEFINHINEQAIDGDRGTLKDRQRNEMKSQTTANYTQLNGNYDDWQILEWKFKIPTGFRPSTSFCHIHQLKAQEGNNSMPLITITPRGSNNGTNRRMQVIHAGNETTTDKGIIVDNVPLEEFENEWVQVQEEIHYRTDGYYRITITRISDQRVLIDYATNNIDMWREGAINIRNKFGIYRSFGKTLADENDRPVNGIKDETLRIADFKAYKK